MINLRKSCPDGSLPLIKSTGLHSFNNVMIFKVPEELRKPGETKYQLATLDPKKDDTSWLADDYVKKLFPDYPKKQRKETKHNEEKESAPSKKSVVKKDSKTEDNGRNGFRHGRNRKYYPKNRNNVSVQRKPSHYSHYRNQNLPSRDNRRHHIPPHNPPKAVNIDPWLRPPIPQKLISPGMIITQPSPDPVFLRPEPIVIHPPSKPFYNQTFNSINSLPIPNVYANNHKSIGLLGDRPSENASFDSSNNEYNGADNSFDQSYAEYNSVDNSLDDYSNYQSYDPDGHNWNDTPPGGWNDNYQDYTQNVYEGNRVHSRNPGLEKNIDFSKGRGWLHGNRGIQNRGIGNRSTGNRGLGNRGLGNRGSGNRGSGNRDSGNRGSGNRSLSNRGSGNRSSGNRRSGNRGPGNRGPGNRGPGNRGTGNMSTYHDNRRGQW